MRLTAGFIIHESHERAPDHDPDWFEIAPKPPQKSVDGVHMMIGRICAYYKEMLRLVGSKQEHCMAFTGVNEEMRSIDYWTVDGLSLVYWLLTINRESNQEILSANTNEAKSPDRELGKTHVV